MDDRVLQQDEVDRMNIEGMFAAGRNIIHLVCEDKPEGGTRIMKTVEEWFEEALTFD